MTDTIKRETRADLMRQAERRMSRAVLADLLRAGYSVTIDNGAAVEVKRGTDLRELMKGLRQTDADYLYCYRDGRCEGWVLLVYGNDAHELVADHSMNMGPALVTSGALAHRLALLGL